MRILITGGTGFIGSALVDALCRRGDKVLILSRSVQQPRPGVSFLRSLDELSSDIQIDAIVNLAGASLAARRWSEAYKREIVASRIDTSAAILALIKRMERPPAVLLSASAIGYYGHHGDELLDESASSTPGFAQQLCAQWEQMACRVKDSGVRICLLRLGVVLDDGGGALKQMAMSFRFGVASWLGSGRQWLSWVHRQDAVRAIVFLLDQPGMHGAVNITAPEPVTSKGFAMAMKAYHRILISAGVPAFIMRLMVGEMAQELLLNGQRVVPRKLLEAGFSFRYPEIDVALDTIYG